MAKKICPYCRETIDKKASICPHCHKKQGTSAGTVLAAFIIVAVICVGIARVRNSSDSDSSSSSIKGTSGSVSVSSSSDYQDIYNEYEQKIRAATPALINEYNAEAAQNTSGLNGLAAIHNAKLSKLADIEAEGVQKMADYCLNKGSGKYSEYSQWVDKLYKVYDEEGSKITDVYMNSTM